jgi:hypothetical protein
VAKKYIEAEDTTRRTGIASGATIIAPTPGPKTFQGPGDMAPPFEGGGRQADLPADYDQRAAADADWRAQLTRNMRQDNQAVGTPKDLDGTPWLKSNAKI